MDKIETVIRSSQVTVHPGRYAYLKGQVSDLGPHFLVAQDGDEETIITEEKNLDKVKFTNAVKWFRLIEIKVSVPFLPGFLSRVMAPIAQAGYNSLIVSTFSKDYLLTREENILEVTGILRNLGFSVKEL